MFHIQCGTPQIDKAAALRYIGKVIDIKTAIVIIDPIFQIEILFPVGLEIGGMNRIRIDIFVKLRLLTVQLNGDAVIIIIFR